MKPIVAIVGRPNVGKSTLFNRLAGQALAIVHDAPGVTRDRNYFDASMGGRPITLIDTGGFDPTTDDPMGRGIARQVEAAIRDADLVVCVLDGSLPPTAADAEGVRLLRRSDKPVLYVANKIDGASREWELTEHYRLGVDELIGVSALHGRHVGKLEAKILDLLPEEIPEDEEAADAERIMRLALIGRPNAGKSSLFNRLTGEERSLVDSTPGTTRDPVDSIITYRGEKMLLVDTAGIRRKARVEKGVEAASVLRSLRVIERARVVVLMCDATEGISDQDSRLLGLSAERGRAIVVGLNKIDLLDRHGVDEAKKKARDALHFAPWAPIVTLSAQTGRGVDQLMKQVKKAETDMARRVPTAQLNRFFDQVLATQPPPTRSGKAPRLYYITQTGVNPPTFVVFTSSPEHVAESYRRFIVNQIRSSFDYEASPVRLFMRGKDRAGDHGD